MTKEQHIGSDTLAFLDSIIPDTPETRRVEKQERFRFALTQAMRDLRKQIGLTQKELAIKLGIGQSWISKLESANNDHTFESVLAYLDALDASFQAIIILENKKVAVISSDPSFSDKVNTAREEEKVLSKNITLSESQTPELELVAPDKKSQCEQAQQVLNRTGFWAISEEEKAA